ncbi:MAG: Fic family protein [Alphaproteobacteria bacterium]|nr:Fic family protein [Alphaproteobacteria bacterium]
MADRARDEGLLTGNRTAELVERPVVGRFDVAHLKEVHRRICQDLPHHGPGEFRPAARGHVKYRELESAPVRYIVHYAPRANVEKLLERSLTELNGGESLKGLDPARFAARMASLYGDLDHAHPFREGNSRTLRIFTSQLARAAGYELDWGTAKADARTRDLLYMARDREVLKLAFPGLDEARAMATKDRDEYEAFVTLNRLAEMPTLEALIGTFLRPETGPD